MNGEKYRTHFHSKTAPVNLELKPSGKEIGVKMTVTDATMINKIKNHVVAFANFRFINKYTEPCASGNPPSKAPTIYQYLRFNSLHPTNIFILSARVPSPKVNTPIVHHSRYFVFLLL